jgi:TonB family protein
MQIFTPPAHKMRPRIPVMPDAAERSPRLSLQLARRVVPAAMFTLALCASAQQPSPAPPANNQPAASPAPHTPPPQPAVAQSPVPAAKHSESSSGQDGGITEDQLRQMLVGKFLYLRDGYLDDSLSFNEHGFLVGHSPEGSFTLNVIQIDKVHLTKHKVELEGARYGLHFLGALPYEDPSKAIDRVRITPKKKMVRISIDREIVVKPKKEKGRQKEAKGKQAVAKTTAPKGPAASEPASITDAEQAQAQIAAAPPEERPADAASVTSAVSPAHATMVLKQALDNIFAPSLDERMMSTMPEFWKLYYQAAAAKTDFKPADPAVIPDGAADTRAKLLTDIQAPSNEYAQQCGVAGMALYHVVVGVDGKPEEIAVARPIGFGLDGSAVAAIRKAKFQPAMKNGRQVPVLLDLVVEFRIYSSLTSAQALPGAAAKTASPSLPGPYSVHHTQP